MTVIVVMTVMVCVYVCLWHDSDDGCSGECGGRDDGMGEFPRED